VGGGGGGGVRGADFRFADIWLSYATL